jgi:hypothetical protein
MRLVLALILALLWPVMAEAFPDNAVVTGGDFTGADNGALHANFTNTIIFGASSAASEIRTNAAGNAGAATESDTVFNTSFNAAQEAFATYVATASVSDLSVCGRLVNLGSSTADGYCAIAVDGSSLLDIYRVDNGVGTRIATSRQVITAGDKFGIKLVGSEICAWFNDTDGANVWFQAVCTVDTTYSAGGQIGFVIGASVDVAALDDFGGGNVTIGAVQGCYLMENNTDFYLMENSTDFYALEGGDGGLCGGTPPAATWPGWTGQGGWH